MNRILVFIFGLILGGSAAGVLGYFHAKSAIETIHYWGVELNFAINAEQGVRHLKHLREEQYEALTVLLEAKIKSDAEGLYSSAARDGEELDSYAKKVLSLVADVGIEVDRELPGFSELNHE